MKIRFRCPDCRQVYSAPATKAGTSLNCQKCGAKMRIPEADAPEETADPRDGDAPESEDGNASVSSRTPVDRPRAAPLSEPPTESKLQSALNDLFADDDEDGTVDPPAPASDLGDDSPAASVTDAPVEFSGPDPASPAKSSGPGGPSLIFSSSDTDGEPVDDLDAVLEFERALEEAGEERAPVRTMLPDLLFADEEDDDEEPRNRADSGDELDMTPMIDVTFLLLIFFMITASFSIQKILAVPPPNPEEQGAAMQERITDIEENSVNVDIDSRNVIFIDDEPLNDPTRLAEMLRSKGRPEILIKAHESSMHDILVKVVDAANEVGMQKIRVGIQRGSD